jgi:hypothetical protein
VADLVLIKEALEHSEYTADHIRKLLNQGIIQGKKVGWIWLVDLDSLREYEQEMKAQGTAKHRPKWLEEKDS